MNKFSKWTLIVIGSLVVLFFIFKTYTKSHSPQEVVEYSSGDLELSVEYSRPYKKDREIFGGLVPFGSTWRTGANEATVFKTNQEISFGGEVLAEGSYSLWTIPTPEKWTVILNTETGQWGVKGPSLEPNKDPANDVLSIEVDPNATASVKEQFEISFNDSDGLKMVMEWDQTKVSVSIN
ncbi:MAG: DUF2911 domain-containing protein [Cyclobacteriaceae bacterium]